ncbi:10037_t:CDS:2 [Cetraspora pellucida]|uniref:10037_t:CDS:1 n=1 Tax=Cetraspora pellucida TaxID=1433469 RepID=A0ACA9LCT7_9GLOM|nr:10037_t:CDS:2 [Cetraspora pellucida]
MSSSTNTWKSENTMCDVLRSAKHVLVIDAFANKSTLAFLKVYHDEDIHIVDNEYQPHIGETVEFIYDLNSRAKAMQIGYNLLKQGKHVAFVSTGAVMARALVKKASKLTKSDNLPLDCIAYTNTVEAKISFEVTDHFDIVIAITNIITPVHVKALAQMLYQIYDCPHCIISLFYKKNSNELFCPPGHCEWDNNTISYKIDESSAKQYLLNTSASLQLIKIDESQKVIENHKKVRNKVRVEALVIKKTDFNAVATFQNLDPEKAENLKFNQECSISDTMALKHFYI